MNKVDRIYKILESFCIDNNIYVPNDDRDRYLEECGYYGREFEYYSFMEPLYGKDSDMLLKEIEYYVSDKDGSLSDNAWHIFDTLSDDILYGNYDVRDSIVGDTVLKIMKILGE